MASSAQARGLYYQRALDSSSPDLDAYRDYLAQVDQLVIILTASALESGIPHSRAVSLAIETFKHVEVLARDQNMELLPEPELAKVYTFCCSILASGTTFAPYEIAQRAVAAANAIRSGLTELFDAWDPVGVEERLKRADRAKRKRAGEGWR